MKIVNAYMNWSSGATKNKVVIVFDTMWNSTDKMARAIADGVASQGVEVKLLKAALYRNSEAVTEILDAKAVLVGSPTLNNRMFPTLELILNLHHWT